MQLGRKVYFVPLMDMQGVNSTAQITNEYTCIFGNGLLYNSHVDCVNNTTAEGGLVYACQDDVVRELTFQCMELV